MRQSGKGMIQRCPPRYIVRIHALYAMVSELHMVWEDGIPPAEIAAILQESGKCSLLMSRARFHVRRLSQRVTDFSGSLEAYTRRPDCFRRAASLIRTRCGDLETDENGRVKGESFIITIVAASQHNSHTLSRAFADVVRNCNCRPSLCAFGMPCVSVGTRKCIAGSRCASGTVRLVSHSWTRSAFGDGTRG